jgi:hypothetical protein
MDLSGAGLLVTAATLLGVVHAFDVDHLVAVATFSSAKSGHSNGLRFCAHWAIGHGLTILLLAVLVYLLGVTLPDSFHQAAEAMVGVALIALGVWALRSLRAHVFSSDTAAVAEAMPIRRKPLAIGALHGLAGSAPILFAFLADAHTPLLGLGLILLFVCVDASRWPVARLGLRAHRRPGKKPDAGIARYDRRPVDRDWRDHGLWLFLALRHRKWRQGGRRN